VYSLIYPLLQQVIASAMREFDEIISYYLSSPVIFIFSCTSNIRKTRTFNTIPTFFTPTMR